MTLVGWAQIALVLALVLACAIPLSKFLAEVYAGERNFLSPVIGPVERGFYRLAGVDPAREQDWFTYTIAMLVFSVAGFLVLYGVQRLQGLLPLNPRGFDAVPPDLAFNTSISFITNTNWQNYAGETTMSHLTQMLGLTVHNFVSAATGLAMAFALVRGFARSSATTVGNFWADLTRITLYILLPIAVLGAILLIALGVPQTLTGSVDAATLEGAKQTIAIGPMASQEIIKELGTNGGGFFNANSAHPFENPNAWTNIIEIFAIFIVPTASVLAFGRIVGDIRQGWAVLAAMAVFLIVGILVAYWAETAGSPILTALGVDPQQVTVTGQSVSSSSRQLAAVQSAPLIDRLNEMMNVSDNVMAECIAREVAASMQRPLSFAGAVDAVTNRLSTAHIDTGSAILRDSSGLSVDDRLTAKILDSVVQAAAGSGQPALRPLLDLLPIAGGSGTLSDRFIDGTPAGSGPSGWLRAKTGSLTAINALAGVVTDRSGRVLSFALISNDAGMSGRTAIDAVAATLWSCGCVA